MNKVVAEDEQPKIEKAEDVGQPVAELQPLSNEGEAAANPDASGSTGEEEKKKADNAEESVDKK